MVVFSSLSLFVIAVIIGLLLTIITGIHSSLAELAMLLGLGGWPGRLAAIHLGIWITAVYYTGSPDGGWLFYSIIMVIIAGTITAPFYLNNATLVKTIRSHAAPVTKVDEFPGEANHIPVTGTVVTEEHERIGESSFSVEPVTAPFTATLSAACEWAVKKKQWLSRRPAYKTIDSGEHSGNFLVDTGIDYVPVLPDQPTLLLNAGVGFLGYETSTTDPAGEPSSNTKRLTSLAKSDMRYCETTLADGDDVTVIGPVIELSDDDNSESHISDKNNGKMYVINEPFGKVKHVIDRYVRWFPHISVTAFFAGWGYVFTLVL